MNNPPKWTWSGKGVHEIPRTDLPTHLLARVVELAPGRFKWRAWTGTEYVEGTAPTESQAKETAQARAGLRWV